MIIFKVMRVHLYPFCMCSSYLTMGGKPQWFPFMWHTCACEAGTLEVGDVQNSGRGGVVVSWRAGPEIPRVGPQHPQDI